MLGQPFVDERVVRAQQIEHAPIFAEDAVDEEFGFLAERLTKIVIEVRIIAHIGADRLQVAQPEPLSGEVTREIVRARIGEHAAGLFLEHVRPVQLTANGCVEQFVIGDAAPEEK